MLKLFKKWLRHYFWVSFVEIKEKFCEQNIFKNFTRITYERILKKSKISRQIGRKNEHLPINSICLASLGLVWHLECKRHRIDACLFPRQIRFNSDSLGSACSVQSYLWRNDGFIHSFCNFSKSNAFNKNLIRTKFILHKIFFRMRILSSSKTSWMLINLH